MENMEYNTSLDHLVIPEYGRNIQKMIDYAMTVNDRNERNKIAHSIIDVMGQLNPHLRDIIDFKHKLWDHLFIISKFKLDVDSPYPLPTAATFKTKPERIKIPGTKRIRYKHYGRITEDLIQKATEYPEGEEKYFLAEIVGNLMKRSYLFWNRDTVSDNVIIDQLEELSNNELKLKDPSVLKPIHVLVPRPPNPNQLNKKHQGGGGRESRQDRGSRKFKRKF
ncbi:MAG: DUF4290 domain-containing protein [Bacteroidota bacterium]